MKNETKNFNPYAGIPAEILNATHFVDINGKLWKSFRNLFEAERAADAARNRGCGQVVVYRAGQKNI